MILPVELNRDDGRPVATRGPVLTLVILLCVLAFGLQVAGGDRLTLAYAHMPGDGSPQRWLTSMFLHGGLGHLVGNMVFLYVFGRSIESKYGSPGFLALYLASGLAAVWAHDLSVGMPLLGTGQSPLALWRLGVRPVLGASGAISGIMAAVLYEFWRRPVTMIWWWPPFVWGEYFQAPVWLIVGLGFAGDLFDVAVGTDTGVAHWAHLGGAAFGFGVAWLMSCWNRGAEATPSMPPPRRGRTQGWSDQPQVAVVASGLDYARRLYLAGRSSEALAILAELDRQGIPPELGPVAQDLYERARLRR